MQYVIFWCIIILVDFMFTIKENIINEIVIKNSRFITVLYKVKSIEEIDNYLNEIRNIYKDATHYCYAYILNNVKKCSDDGEPSGTAGIPMIQVLEKNNVNYILCIVIRYFGGIKLGSNGLIRAYSKCVSNALNNCNMIELISGYNVDIIFSYENLNNINYILKDNIILNKQFNEEIIYNLDIDKILLDKIISLNYEVIINEEKLIEKNKN